MDIGFIGLGNMGFHMARRLVEAGHRLTVTDTRPEAVERLTRLGAKAAATLTRLELRRLDAQAVSLVASRRDRDGVLSATA